jgi:Zn-dependent peptidase ImmA (M78 family)/DNA-binding XRE family transcriptional regulator
VDKHVLNTIDAEIIGERLAEARRTRGMTQIQAAEALGVARTTIVAIEKGDRRPRAAELVKLAQLYGQPMGTLVRDPADPAPPDFIVQFRAARSTSRSDSESNRDADIRRFENLCRWYVELEESLGAPLPRRYPDPYDISGAPPERAAEEVANSERIRLGLGDGPVGDLWSLLESDIGLRLFGFSMNAGAVAGLFVYTEAYGGCVAINTNHPEDRQRMSGAHEYAHFLTSRLKPEITIVRRSFGRSASERFADAFARFFLMPASGLTRRFEAIRRAKNRPITPADVLTLSHLYRVSAQAMTLRLEELKLLPNGTWDRLKELGFKPNDARELMHLTPDAGGSSDLSHRYSTLAVQAYKQGLLTEGQLAERLETDRLSARDRVRALTTQSQVSEDGGWRQIPFDLSLPLIEMA